VCYMTSRPVIDPATAAMRPGATLELTRRERQVLQLVADGLANREVGDVLYVTEDTVKSHIRNILAKLGASSRANAVAIGIRARLIR
jgi:two-component system, NarL family, nitrate/nitrite response regulator NarL